jgi:hypothetical protein
MEFSLPALIGAAVGTVLGAINYTVLIGVVERALRAHDTSKDAAERETFESKISIMRRLVLGMDVLLFGGIGYLAGKAIGG